MTHLRRFIVVGLMLIYAAFAFEAGSAGQVDVDNSITLRVYTCPPGMTFDTLNGDECTRVIDGFDVQIISLGGIMAPMTLLDATLAADAFVWDNQIIDDRGAYGPLAIEETVIPDGFTEYAVTGGGISFDELGYWKFSVTPDNPTPELAIYNFALTEPPIEETSSLEATPELPGLAVEIRTGVCDNLGTEAGIPLSPIATSDSHEGSSLAIPVASFYSTIGTPLDELLASGHAVVVKESSAANDDAVVACGAIGGELLADGAIASGLSEQNNSGFSGVAYITPLPGGDIGTGISAFVFQDLDVEG
jgi:hypothetical protein